jgi:hypothetical protein
MIKQADFDKDLIKFGAHQLVHIYCAEIARLQAELKAEQARLDWALSSGRCSSTFASPGRLWTERYTTRAELDAAMKGATQ